MKVTVDQFKRGLSLAIFLGDILAPRTETKVDDLALEKLRALQANDAAIAFFVALLGGGQPTVDGLSAADVELAQGVFNNAAARELAEFAASQIL